LELAVDLDAEDIARGQLEGLASRAHDGPTAVLLAKTAAM
jgi:hypothetical protein